MKPTSPASGVGLTFSHRPLEVGEMSQTPPPVGQHFPHPHLETKMSTLLAEFLLQVEKGLFSKDRR